MRAGCAGPPGTIPAPRSGSRPPPGTPPAFLRSAVASVQRCLFRSGRCISSFVALLVSAVLLSTTCSGQLFVNLSFSEELTVYTEQCKQGVGALRA